MSALSLYRSLAVLDRKSVRRRALRLAGYKLNARLADVITDDDHPALAEALREWWHVTDAWKITEVITKTRDVRLRELTTALHAEGVAHLTNDPRVAECRRLRLACARGEVDSLVVLKACDALFYDSQAPTALWASALISPDAVYRVVVLYLRISPWDAGRLFAVPLRTLYPDPSRLDCQAALVRWDAAVAQVHAAVRTQGVAA